jgi:hypothetical protein
MHPYHFAIRDYMQCWNRSAVPASTIRTAKTQRWIGGTCTRHQRRSRVPFLEVPLTLCLGVKLKLCRRSSVAPLRSDVPGFSPL